MAVPKRRPSKQKQRQRRSSHKFALTALKPCPNCGALHRPHRICPACGFYDGKQAVKVVSNGKG